MPAKTMTVIAAAATIVLTGCLTRPHLDKHSYLFALPPPSAPKVVPASARVLGLRSVLAAAPFDGRSFVYRTGEFSYARDPYAEFLVRPEQGLVEPILAWFRKAGLFSAVVEPGSALKSDTLLEVQVVRLYADFRPGENASAVLALRLVFIDSPSGIPGKVLFQKEYTRTIALKERTAAALIESWDQALAQILDAAAQDFPQTPASASLRTGAAVILAGFEAGDFSEAP